MEIGSIKELIEELKFFDSLDNEGLPEAITTLEQGYRLLNDKAGDDTFEQRVETLELSLDYLLLNDDGLVLPTAKSQLAKYGWTIEKIDRKIHRFDYVLKCKYFDVLFGG